MKIDILLTVGKRGGVENVINAVSIYLQKKGYDIRIVQMVWDGAEWTPEGIPFFGLIKGGIGRYYYEDFVKEYSKFITENGAPDMVLATAWPRMCYVARKASADLNINLKIISWPHAPIEQYERAGFGSYQSLANADAHFAISETIYRGIVQRCPGKPVFMVHNPVSEEQFSRDLSRVSSYRKQARNHKKRLFFVGRVSKEKHVEVIIRAIADVKDTWELHIVGSGEESYQTELHKIIKEMKVGGNVIWYGWKEHPWQYTGEADAVILASEYEGFPLVAIEALANGIPVIATPVSGLVELIKPGINGYLYPLGDSKGLAEVLQAIDRGILPIIEPQVCRDSVEDFRLELAIRDFEKKILECAKYDSILNKAGSTEAFLNYKEKISVIVPCHNAEKYLEECLDSIVHQTYPLERMEIIIVNDASEDNSNAIMQKYEEMYPEQIMLINLEQNQGVAMARNIGMQYISGDYVMFVDSDDKIEENIVESLYDKCKLYGCDYAECGYTMFAEGGAVRHFSKENRYLDLEKTEDLKYYIVKYGASNAVWGRLYRTAFLFENEISFPQFTCMEDIMFHQMSMMKARKVVVIEDEKYWYRCHDESIMHSPERSRYIMDRFNVQEMTYQTLMECETEKMNSVREEFALLYYVKAFVGTVDEIQAEQMDVFDDENFKKVKETMLQHFPDLLENSYIKKDKWELNQRYIELLERNF